MRLKSFFGPTVPDAMRLVREALGDDAIIIATRDDEAGGVRITAAIEDSIQAKDTTLLEQEIDGNCSRIIELIAEELLKHQVPNALAERLLAAATQFADDDPVMALGSAFNTHMQFHPIADRNAGKPLMLIGPPGAGKTMCAAKFAIQAALAKKHVTVISTDTERAGGIEQLAAFTRLLKRDLVEIEDAASLREVIKLQPSNAFVIVDTAGRNPFRDSDRQLLRPIVDVCGEAVLVLPANMDAFEAIDMAHEFRSLGATRMLLTRLDITRRLGNMLRTAFESRLPLANFSATNKATEAPQPFNPIALAKLILPASLQVENQATGTHGN